MKGIESKKPDRNPEGFWKMTETEKIATRRRDAEEAYQAFLDWIKETSRTDASFRVSEEALQLVDRRMREVQMETSNAALIGPQALLLKAIQQAQNPTSETIH